MDIKTRLRPGNTLLNRYRVIRLLGQGAMGVVVAARDMNMAHTVAIKLMLERAIGFGNALERFVREAHAARKLSSENVANVLDAGQLDDGTPYIVLEYLEGVNLADLHHSVGPFAVEDAIDVTLQICAAIAEAHSIGVIHRDIKPANLFVVQRDDGTPLIKLLDFGLSKLQETADKDPSLTDTVGTMGSPTYMSPEQTRSAKYVDERSDIWSIGVTLYQLLSGRVPFEAESRAELFAAILHADPADLHTYAPWVPQDLAATLRRTLDKDPELRFQRVTELATELSAFASDWGRAFSQSSHVPVPWPVAPRAQKPAETRSNVVIDQGPERLNLADFLGNLPTRAYDLRQISSQNDALNSADDSDAVSGAVSHPPDSQAWRDGTEFVTRRRRYTAWYALVAAIALAVAVAVWFVSGQRETGTADAAEENLPSATTSTPRAASTTDGTAVLPTASAPDNRAPGSNTAHTDDAHTARPLTATPSSSTANPSAVTKTDRHKKSAKKKPAKKKPARKKRTESDDASSGLFDTME